jgi:hypothetical protein
MDGGKTDKLLKEIEIMSHKIHAEYVHIGEIMVGTDIRQCVKLYLRYLLQYQPKSTKVMKYDHQSSSNQIYISVTQFCLCNSCTPIYKFLVCVCVYIHNSYS